MERFITEQICRLTDSLGNDEYVKIVTEYGYTASGNVLAVSAHYADARNDIVTVGTRTVTLTGDYVVQANASSCLPITEVPVCHTDGSGNSQTIRLLTEYGWNASNDLIVSKTIYTSQDGVTVVDPTTLTGSINFGACACLGTIDTTVYMFEVQLTDSFDSTYYYYGGTVGPDWQVHRYLQDNPADPLYLVPQIAEASSNSGVVDLTSAWTSRTTLNYA